MAIKKINTDLQIEAGLLDGDGNSGSSNQILISTGTGIDWVDGSGSSIIGGPYLPLSGGTMTGVTQFNDHTQHGDQVSAKWGAGSDLTIKHNATDSFIENYTGHLSIVNYANDKDIVLWNDDGTGGIAKYLVLDGGTTHAYFSNPGNVGIGTTSPQSKLHVAKNGNANGGSILMGEGGSGTNKWSYLAGTHYNQATGSGNGTGSAGVAIIGSLATETYNKVIIGGNPYELNAATKIEFWTHSGTLSTQGGTIRGYVDNGGNWFLGDTLWVDAADDYVGIGTTNPDSKLEITGDTSSALLTVKSDSGGSNDAFMRFYDADGGSTYSMGLDSSDGKFKIAYDADGDSLTSGTRLVMDTFGNVGIGTTSPSFPLHLESSNDVLGYFKSTDNKATLLVADNDTSGYFSAENGRVSFGFGNGASTSNVTVVDGTYNVGIGTTSPSEKLQVSGNVKASNFILSSDKRLKENVLPLQHNAVKVDWKSFNLKDQKEEYRTGVIAQELEENHPEFVKTDDKGYKSVKYIDLLIAKIAELENRIKQLEK